LAIDFDVVLSSEWKSNTPDLECAIVVLAKSKVLLHDHFAFDLVFEEVVELLGGKSYICIFEISTENLVIW